jgi:hypothetical protein
LVKRGFLILEVNQLLKKYKKEGMSYREYLDLKRKGDKLGYPIPCFNNVKMKGEKK